MDCSACHVLHCFVEKENLAGKWLGELGQLALARRVPRGEFIREEPAAGNQAGNWRKQFGLAENAWGRRGDGRVKENPAGNWLGNCLFCFLPAKARPWTVWQCMSIAKNASIYAVIPWRSNPFAVPQRYDFAAVLDPSVCPTFIAQIRFALGAYFAEWLRRRDNGFRRRRIVCNRRLFAAARHNVRVRFRVCYPALAPNDKTW